MTSTKDTMKDPYAGFEFEDARPPMMQIDGFLRRPHKDRPEPTQYIGVLRKTVDYKDERGKEQFFLIFETLTDQPESKYETQANETTGQAEGEILTVAKGLMLGVSGSGAIKAVREKVNHIVRLVYTGKKVTTKNGDMWEVDAKVSTKPYDAGAPKASIAAAPFA